MSDFNNVIILDQSNVSEIVVFASKFQGAYNNQLIFQVEGESNGEITNFDGASVAVLRLLDTETETPPASNWHPLTFQGSQVVFNALDQNYEETEVMKPASYRFDLTGATGNTKVVIRYRFK